MEDRPRLIYLAHAYGGEYANLARAKRWLHWALLRAIVDNGFVIAPWITICEVLPRHDSKHAAPEITKVRDFMLKGDCETVRRCDALWLCGTRISAGMALEEKAAYEVGIPVIRFVETEPPQP